MRIFKKYLSALFMLLMLPSTEGLAEALTAYVQKTDELLGCWQRITFSEEVMAEQNAIEPWPQPYQWYCFFADGFLRSIDASFEMEVGSSEELQATLSDMRGVTTYQLGVSGQLLTHHKDADQKVLWIAKILLVPRNIGGKELPPGTLLMTIRDPKSPGLLYMRFLRKLD